MLFRGILLADAERRFRPDEQITRAELAGAISQTIRLEPPRRDPPVIDDVPATSPWAEEITNVVAARLMSLDDRRAFRPAQPVAQSEATAIWLRLAAAYRGEPLSTSPTPGNAPGSEAGNQDRVAGSGAAGALTRQQAAEAICRIVGFPW